MAFQRLATVELQLIMQHCDFKTLLALARCSRFTFAAASNPFAWRYLPPLSLALAAADAGARLSSPRLLASCDVALRWLPPTDARLQPDVKAAELAAIESVARLVQLDVRMRRAQHAHLRRLLSHPSLSGLTALHCCSGQMDDSCTALLPLHQPRLRTLTLQMSTNRDSDADRRLLVPLALLLSLTDLTLDGIGGSMDESAAEIIGRCASLRRLHLANVRPAVVFAVLGTPAQVRLESLSLRFVHAGLPQPFFGLAADAPISAADVQSWKASFENLHSLRFLSVQHCTGHEVIFAGAAAALATGTALRSLTALRADSLKMDNEGGSLIPLLTAHCPQLRRLHIYEINGRLSSRDRGALARLPLLSSLTDLRLQCNTRFSHDDELAVGCCSALARLHLITIGRSSLHSTLLSPQMQRLESLTLQSVHFDRDNRSENQGAHSHSSNFDWSLCFANLRSLRELSLDGCDGGDRLLAGVQAACPPLLCFMRLSHSDGDSGTGVTPQLQLLPALLALFPALRVELLTVRGISCRAVLKAPQLRVLYNTWHKLKRQYPARVTITQLDNKIDFDPFSSWTD